MPARKNGAIPILKVKKGDSLKTIYAKARKAFTADDLAKYLREEEMIPMEKVIAELEAIQRDGTRKRPKKAKKKA